MNKKFSLLLGLLFVLSLFAACTGSQPADQNAQENTEVANEQTQEETAAEAEEQAESAEEKAEEMKEEEKADEVTKELEEDIADSLLKALSGNVQYSVVYDYDSTFDGETMGGELGMFFKGENFRTDSKITYDGKPIESRMIVKEGESVTCTKDGEWSCMKFTYDPSEDTSGTSTVADTEENIPNYKITSLPDRTVAGTNTDCYMLVYKPGVEDYDATFEQEFCHSKEGVPLYIDMKSGEMTSKMVAKSYKTSVSDSEFNPPAEPKSLDDMMAGYGGAGGYDIPNY